MYRIICVCDATKVQPKLNNNDFKNKNELLITFHLVFLFLLFEFHYLFFVIQFGLFFFFLFSFVANRKLNENVVFGVCVYELSEKNANEKRKMKIK